MPLYIPFAVTYDSEQPWGETGNKIFPCPGTHYGVVGPGHCGAVVGSHHETHLNELRGIARQSGGEEGRTYWSPCVQSTIEGKHITFEIFTWMT